ncbi:MAG: hypothetical protein EOP52_13115 [Sphingobacteriales bacterium]|nr:MAG: hypothetical protein EOP52_13115 [Sphingobacteriales bacterium]
MDKRQAVSKFLSEISSRPALEIEMLKELVNNKKSFIMVNGVFFERDKTYFELEKECLKAIYKDKKYSPSLISDEEIKSLLRKFVANQSKSQQNETTAFFKSLNEKVERKFLYILPNHSLELSDHVKDFQIGPVRCTRAGDLRAELSNFNLISDPIKRGLEIADGIATYFISEQCYEFQLECSHEMARSQAQWYVDIALSIFRLFSCIEKAHSNMFPKVGETDPASFIEKQSVEAAITIDSLKKEAMGGGWAIVPKYEVYPSTVELFEKSKFKEIAIEIFDIELNTLKSNLQRMLGWMTKARASEDLATRFLMFFTALEALLSNNDKSAPITDTIARNVSTIVSTVENRYATATRVKELYGIRSQLVHSGMRDVSLDDCRELQILTEMTCTCVLMNAFNQDRESFHSDLRKAGFGLAWPIQ